MAGLSALGVPNPIVGASVATATTALNMGAGLCSEENAGQQFIVSAGLGAAAGWLSPYMGSAAGAEAEALTIVVTDAVGGIWASNIDRFRVFGDI